MLPSSMSWKQVWHLNTIILFKIKSWNLLHSNLKKKLALEVTIMGFKIKTRWEELFQNLIGRILLKWSKKNMELNLLLKN